MAVIDCPTCHAKTPAAAISCVHCGALAPTCWKCGGTGGCPKCKGSYPKVAGCGRCNKSGRCPSCDGRKRVWK